MKNIFSKIFNIKSCLITIAILILLVVVFIKIFLYSLKPTIYDNPKDYLVLKEKIVEQNKIKHFPEKIPSDATDVHFYGYTDMPYNGELILLEFKTNKKFIENELNKNDFWNKSDKIGQEQKIYFVPKVRKDFDEKDYTYYVINIKENEEYYKKYFPGRNWIGVNTKAQKIIYCHSVASD